MDYAQQQRDPARHVIGFLLVVLLHVIVIYALVNGLARKVIDVIKKPIETKIVEERKAPPPPEAPPPPPPKITVPPPPFIPPPEIQIAVPPPVQNTITAVTTKAPPPMSAPMTPISKPGPSTRPSTPASLDRGKCPTPEPQYPMASRRNQESGTLVLHVQVDANGTASKVEVSRSSGYARLDESAKSWILTCPFKPSIVDGHPQASWTSQAYTFTLRD